MTNELLQLIGVGFSFMIVSLGHLLYFAHMAATARTRKWYGLKTAALFGLFASALLTFGAAVAICIDRFAAYAGACLSGIVN